MATKITTPELFNLSSNNTAATQLPVFTTSTRPTPTTSTVQVDYLVVAGGGGSGAAGYSGSGSGGGGAGGLLTSIGSTALSLNTSTSYSITVGDGGTPVTGVTTPRYTTGNNGSNSEFSGTGITTITAIGGGAGSSGADSQTTANSGGSGGGSGYNGTGANGTAGQGNAGGSSSTGTPFAASGGGGAGSPGSGAPNNSTGGDGGSGLSNSITGATTFYAGGGGGSPSYNGTGTGGSGGSNIGGDGTSGLVGNSGATNTGSGGGAGSPTTSGHSTGGAGGSGIVILRYPTSSSSAIKTTGSLVYTESTDGSDTVIQFTEGSGNVSFASAGIAVGEMIFNSTTEKVEYWDGFQWNMIKDEAIIPPLSTTDPFGDGSQLALYQFNGNANNTNGTNNGIVSGSGGYTTGKFGQAINITGATTSYVYSLKPPAFNQSMCFWVDFSNINFNADKTFYLNTGGSSYFYWWYYALFYQLSSDKFYFGAYSRNSSANYNYRGTGYTLTNLNKTGWNFLVVTYPSGGNATYSINNSIIATAPLTSGQSGNITTLVADNQIGRVYSNGSLFFYKRSNCNRPI